MKIYFLGTGTSQGVPAIASTHPICNSKDNRDKRLRSSVMLSWQGINVNIDCSPDFRTQMLNHRVTHLNAILFTHEHADHTAGLDDIRPFVYRQGDMPIYAQSRVIEQLQHRFEYIFQKENKYPGAPSVEIFHIDNSPFDLFGKQVIPIEVMHGRLPILGYRVHNMAYITDAKYIEASQMKKLRGVKVLIINALRWKPHPTHYNVQQALNIIEQVAPDRAYLTHIGQDMGFHSWAESLLPKNVFLAYDNLIIEL